MRLLIQAPAHSSCCLQPVDALLATTIAPVLERQVLSFMHEQHERSKASLRTLVSAQAIDQHWRVTSS